MQSCVGGGWGPAVVSPAESESFPPSTTVAHQCTHTQHTHPTHNPSTTGMKKPCAATTPPTLTTCSAWRWRYCVPLSRPGSNTCAGSGAGGTLEGWCVGRGAAAGQRAGSWVLSVGAAEADVDNPVCVRWLAGPAEGCNCPSAPRVLPGTCWWMSFRTPTPPSTSWSSCSRCHG